MTMERLPARSPRPMKHLRSYARNNDPRATAAWLAYHDHGSTDMDVHAFEWGEDGPEPWHTAGMLVLLCIHFRRAARAGFRYLELANGRRRRLTRVERRSDVTRWPAEKVLALRTRRRGGSRPMTVYEAIDLHVAGGGQVWMVCEGKPGSANTGRVQPWRSAREYADSVGFHRLGMKTMPTRGWERRMAAAHLAGISTTPIGGGHPRRQTIRRKPPWMDQVWGPRNWRF